MQKRVLHTCRVGGSTVAEKGTFRYVTPIATLAPPTARSAPPTARSAPWTATSVFTPPIALARSYTTDSGFNTTDSDFFIAIADSDFFIAVADSDFFIADCDSDYRITVTV